MDTRPRGWGWIGRLQARTFDRLLVGVLLLLGLTNAIVDLRFIEREPRFPLGGPGGMAIPFFVGLALLLVQVVPLLWRRRHPGLVLLFVAGAFAARVLLSFNPGIAGFGLLVAMYSVAAYEVGARRLFFLVVAGLGFVAGFVVFGVTGNPRSFAITVPSLFFLGQNAGALIKSFDQPFASSGAAAPIVTAGVAVLVLAVYSLVFAGVSSLVVRARDVA